MSRVGRKPIVVPKDVHVQVTETRLSIQGPKGSLTTPVPAGIRFAVESGQLVCSSRA